MDRLRQRFPHTLVLGFEPRGGAVPIGSLRRPGAGRDDLDVCCDFLAHVRGGYPASTEERALFARPSRRRGSSVRLGWTSSGRCCPVWATSFAPRTGVA